MTEATRIKVCLNLSRPISSATIVKKSSTSVETYWCTCVYTLEKSPTNASTAPSGSRQLGIETITSVDIRTRNLTCAMHAAFVTIVSTNSWSTQETSMSIWRRRKSWQKYQTLGIRTNHYQNISRTKSDCQIWEVPLQIQKLMSQMVPRTFCKTY
jgi:hypothetical protein